MSVVGDVLNAAGSEGLTGRIARGWKAVGGEFLTRSGLSIFDQGVVSGTSFATSVLLGRFATQDELGVYFLALSVVYFARGVQEQLVCAPYIIYCGRKEGRELCEYAGSALMHQCAVMVVTAGVLLAALAAGVLPAEVGKTFGLLALAAPLLLVREFARQMSFAHLELGRATALDVCAAGLQFVALFGLAVCGRLTVASTLAALALASGIATIGWLATSRRGMAARAAGTARDWFHNWRFARWALASQLLASTTPYVMPWVIAFTHGEAQTGLLGACSTLVGLSNTFLQGLCNFLSPRAAQAYARGGIAELQGVLVKTALLFAATLGGLAAAAFLFGEQVAVLVYGAQFAGAGPIIFVLSLSVLANSIGAVAGNGLWAIERPSANFKADLCSLGFVIVATVVFVPLWGPLGAALTTLTGTASDAAIRVWILRLAMQELAAEREAA